MLLHVENKKTRYANYVLKYFFKFFHENFVQKAMEFRVDNQRNA